MKTGGTGGRRAVLRGLAAAAALLFLATVPGHAQLMVTADQHLTFGQVTPGVASTVVPTDVLRRAAFTIATQGKYQLTFTLPAQLVRVGGGGQIPLVFGATDGRVDIRHKITTFNPSTGVSIHINPAEQYGEVFLGGRAQPAAGIQPGTYQATITMIVVQTGN